MFRLSRFREYLAALLATGIATGLILALQRTGYHGTAPLFGAVVVSAWYGGVGPGMFSLVLCSIIGYCLSPGRDTPGAEQVDLIRTAVFAAVALLTSVLHLATRRAREAAEKARDAADLARAAAEEASATKTRFLAMVSHELRNPLDPVLMAVAAAKADPVVGERAKEELEIIRRNVEIQGRLIDDLVDVARVAHGKLKLTLTNLNLHDPLRAAVRSCQDALQKKRLELGTDFTADHTAILGDSSRLQQVFWNLLRNAIKFTPEGGSISVRTYNESPGSVVVEVADTGIGIEQHRFSSIFSAFEQGGDNITRRFGGLGLGLSICGALVDAHGGSVTAASQGPGKGSTFTVRIPLKSAAAVLDPQPLEGNPIPRVSSG
ncbi:MAG: HAMP domain-containing sensor histidine kinase [Tepidisphaeraceae bacterium]|jgi:signal transduction histidine kinase